VLAARADALRLEIDQIIPGGANRLLRMAEKEQTHRIEDAKRAPRRGRAGARMWRRNRGRYLQAAEDSAAQ
jgi:uncharacterized membrane protein